jgi:hypothetical protein
MALAWPSPICSWVFSFQTSMKKTWMVFLGFTIFIGCSTYIPADGDIIFQTSLSNQSRAVQIATGSPLSHMGIIYIQDGKPYVFEASNIVKATPLQKWIHHGKKNKYVVKRLTQGVPNKQILAKMIKVGRSFDGLPYDLHFNWSDEKMYCSELVWKIYALGAGIELAPLKKLKDFNLNNPAVKQKLSERYRSNLPLEEPVVSPKDIFESDKLVTVFNKDFYCGR